jgi:hypothetical protein
VAAVEAVAGIDRHKPRELVTQRFAVERMAQDYVKLYERIKDNCWPRDLDDFILAMVEADGFSMKDDASHGELGANCDRNCASYRPASSKYSTVPPSLIGLRSRLFQLRLVAGLRSGGLTVSCN